MKWSRKLQTQARSGVHPMMFQTQAYTGMGDYFFPSISNANMLHSVHTFHYVNSNT
jgi:hypothetical protein